MTKTVYIIAARYDDNEWYNIYYTSETLEDAKKHWKGSLKAFFSDGPDDCTVLKLVECKFDEKQFAEFHEHFKECAKDTEYMYNEDFTEFMKKYFHEQGKEICFEDCSGSLEIIAEAEDNNQDPNDSKVFTKLFNKYYNLHYI